ncbi:unnamed protein product [Paramecium pentaurelia]|uniref:Uncharacterized protein n=1 Tax=Paramecium pentaurelia TaxID=43138 RepID=A0A8S1SCX2_9CILI|nr:unnamed protein product [Paramecium pentaurelia]
MSKSLLIIFVLLISLKTIAAEEIDLSLIRVPNYITQEDDIQLYKIRKQQLEFQKSKYMKMSKEERKKVEQQSLAFQKWENDLKRKYQYKKRQDDL